MRSTVIYLRVDNFILSKCWKHLRTIDNTLQLITNSLKIEAISLIKYQVKEFSKYITLLFIC